MTISYEFEKKIRHTTTYKLQKTEKLHRFRSKTGVIHPVFTGIKTQNGKKMQLDVFLINFDESLNKNPQQQKNAPNQF